jgi:hypothetical protein
MRNGFWLPRGASFTSNIRGQSADKSGVTPVFDGLHQTAGYAKFDFEPL